MDDLVNRIQQWSSEYTEIGGHPVPAGFARFVAARLIESGMVPDSKDWITIYRDGKKERVRITGQDGSVVTYQKSDGGYCATTVDMMRKWSNGSRLAAAVDYSKNGCQQSEQASKIEQQLGGTSGTGTISIGLIGSD